MAALDVDQPITLSELPSDVSPENDGTLKRE